MYFQLFTLFRAEFAGENFVRFSGDTTAQATAQLFAWEAHGKGVDVHLLAEPTKLELLQKEYEQKKEQFKSSVSQVMEIYSWIRLYYNRNSISDQNRHCGKVWWRRTFTCAS